MLVDIRLVYIYIYILEIQQQIYWETCQKDPNIVTEILNTEKPEPSHQKGKLGNINRNTTHPDTTKQKLREEEKYEC